jgi:hypothetical protein
MRELYESVVEFYALAEALSKQPSSPLSRRGNNVIGNDMINYRYNTKYEDDKIKDHTGAIHDITWDNNTTPTNKTNKEKNNSLHDVVHAHNYFIQNVGDVGDMISNNPIGNDPTSGVEKNYNKRERLYRKFGGFGNVNKDNTQYGVIKAYPDDHPDESLRGKKYAHPVEHKEIENHKYITSGIRNIRNNKELTPDERMKILNKNTKPFEKFLKDQKDSTIKKLQPTYLRTGENHLQKAQYTRNTERSSIGNQLDGYEAKKQMQDRTNRLNAAVARSNEDRGRTTGRFTKQELDREKSYATKNPYAILKNAQRNRNLHTSSLRGFN